MQPLVELPPFTVATILPENCLLLHRTRTQSALCQNWLKMCYFGLEPWLNSEINGNKRRLQTTLSVFGRIELRVNLLKLQPTLFALATRRHRVTKFIHFIVFVFVMCVYLHLSLCLYLHLYLCWYLYLRLYLCQSTLFTPARRRHRVTKCVHLIQNST